MTMSTPCTTLTRFFPGKTWYYRALHCTLKCVVLVLVPLIPLLEEALQGAKDAGLRAKHLRDLPKDAADLAQVIRGGCIVFCSFEAAASGAADALLDAAVDFGGAVVIDEAHMVRLDMRCVQGVHALEPS